jgi:DNA-directed RNA polymerase subunit N (RpoN/RPB10)
MNERSKDPNVPHVPLKDDEIARLLAEFEAVAQLDDNGTEFWFARDLQVLLEYERWENFLEVIKRAQTACFNSGQVIIDHFRETTKMIELGKKAHREIEDFRLTRYACYLITQNGDAKKRPVAFGQTYFAIQTRRQELADQVDGSVQSSEDEKRIFLRNQIKEHNNKLSKAAKDAGVVTPQEFAIFHSKGYQGLYGKTVPEIRKHKKLPPSVDILDRMGSTELAANFFRVTQTEEKLRKDQIKGLNKAYSTHYAVGRQVRDAMLKISGIPPEDLAVADNIKNAEKRIKAEQSLPFSAQADTQNETVSNQIVTATNLPTVEDRHPVNLTKDLWKFALLIMALRPDGMISTSDLIRELPKYIQIPEASQTALTGRTDNKFTQIVRNLKSHKFSKTNFIHLGYAEDIKGGFKITDKGIEFVKSYFSA